jgi:hypothetical protein
MASIDALQVRIATRQFVLREADAADGVQELLARIGSGTAPETGQVWEELELTGLPWTVQNVQHVDGRPNAVTLRRPANVGDRLPAAGQYLDLVRQHAMSADAESRLPFQS